MNKFHCLFKFYIIFINLIIFSVNNKKIQENYKKVYKNPNEIKSGLNHLNNLNSNLD